MKIINKNVIAELPNIQNGSIDLIILDPPFMEGFSKYFEDFRAKLKPNGQMLWFVQPTELYVSKDKAIKKEIKVLKMIKDYEAFYFECKENLYIFYQNKWFRYAKQNNQPYAK